MSEIQNPHAAKHSKSRTLAANSKARCFDPERRVRRCQEDAYLGPKVLPAANSKARCLPHPQTSESDSRGHWQLTLQLIHALLVQLIHAPWVPLHEEFQVPDDHDRKLEQVLVSQVPEVYVRQLALE